MNVSISRKHQTGLTLIEILVTLLVMSIGLLGLAGLQATSIKDGLDVSKRSQVTWIANDIIERIRASAAADIAYIAQDPDNRTNVDTIRDAYPVSFTSGGCSAPSTACSDTSSTDASACSAAQIALQDIQETFCGQSAPTGVIANSPDSLNLTSVAVTCPSGCSRTSDISVTISWISQNVSDSRVMTATNIAAQETSTITMTVRP